MKIVGIDTSTAAASVALVENGKLLLEEVRRGHFQNEAYAPFAGRSNHAEVILPLLEALLKRAGMSLGEINAFALSIGPGSFTGLRIGLSTIKGLTFGWDIPVVGVSTLWGHAARVPDWEGWICPFLDARKHEVYGALFRRQGGLLERVLDDLVASPEKMLQFARTMDGEDRWLFIGDGVETYRDSILHVFGERASMTLGDDCPSTASAIAILGEGHLQQGKFDSVGELVPVYLRPSEAELKRRN